MEIRNIAIIAHVDHGKTTLTDALMRQTGMVKPGISMDSNQLEQEKGITIYSKNASIIYKNTKINIVDTPGHADFGSEVERVIRSIDSVLLVVDAQEGPMPQTKFVLKKSLKLGLKPIVVINKIDKPAARPQEVLEMVYELFLDLGANDEQLDFPFIYAIGREGIAKLDLKDTSSDLTPLLDLILAKVKSASDECSKSKPFIMQTFNLAYDNFIGRLAIGRIYQGMIKSGAKVFVKDPIGSTTNGNISKLFTFEGLQRKEVSEAQTGDIVMVAGLPDIYIGQTICADDGQEPMPAIAIDEPTIALNFLVNKSPFTGRDGKLVTNNQIKERLKKELEINVGLKIDFSSTDCYRVCGRGELHIAILLENMRREGYEIAVSQPTVIIKEENGQKMEPFEEVTVLVSQKMTGAVIEKILRRKGKMIEMKPEHGQIRLVFELPTRGFLGYRGEFIIDTKGEGVIYSRMIGFRPFAGEIEKSRFGSMVSIATGKASAFSLANLQERGTLYIGPAIEVYEGMIIGNVAKGNDLLVNPIKGKHLTNMRSKASDEAINLTPPLELTLERGLSIMNEDEYLEITPKNIRLRKQYLTEIGRVRAGRKK